jgi:hypothetical protein
MTRVKNEVINIKVLIPQLYSSSNLGWPLGCAEERLKCKMWNKDATRCGV